MAVVAAGLQRAGGGGAKAVLLAAGDLGGAGGTTPARNRTVMADLLAAGDGGGPGIVALLCGRDPASSTVRDRPPAWSRWRRTP